MAQDRMSVNH